MSVIPPSGKSFLHAVIRQNGLRKTRDFTIKDRALGARNLFPGLEFSRRQVYPCLYHLPLAHKRNISFARHGIARFPGEYQGFGWLVQKYAFKVRVVVEMPAGGNNVINRPIFLGVQCIERVLHLLSQRGCRRQQAGERHKTG